MTPARVEKFAQTELSTLLQHQQLHDLPLISDAALSAAGVMLRDALEDDEITSGVKFEAMSRVLLEKLLQRYGQHRAEDVALSASFTSAQSKRILAHIRTHPDQTITLNARVSTAGMSPSR